MPYHLTHPESEIEIEVDADQVSNYQAQGWQLKPGASDPSA